MLRNDQELEATLERIRYFQQQVEKLRQAETNPQTIACRPEDTWQKSTG